MTKKSAASCSCPVGSRRITTKGRGRGWACQSLTGKGKFRPFVKANCR